MMAKIKDVNPKDKDIAYDEEDKRLLENPNENSKDFIEGKLEMLRRLNKWMYGMGKTTLTPILIERNFIDKEKKEINKQVAYGG